MEPILQHINPDVHEKWRSEPSFSIFKHNGMLCCIMRNVWTTGNFCGYVAVGKDHPFYGNSYNSKVVVKDTSKINFNNNWLGLLTHDAFEMELGIVRLDLYFDVHGGMTWANDHCAWLEKDVFPELWWFGFDTSHAGDTWAMQTRIAGRSIPWKSPIDTYKNFDFTKKECCKLADQLAVFQPTYEHVKPAAFYYKVLAEI